jgi:hypothetical protein
VFPAELEQRLFNGDDYESKSAHLNTNVSQSRTALGVCLKAFVMPKE